MDSEDSNDAPSPPAKNKRKKWATPQAVKKEAVSKRDEEPEEDEDENEDNEDNNAKSEDEDKEAESGEGGCLYLSDYHFTSH